MIQEFKDFINKGNLVDMAVAFVLGTAFAALVKSFTDDILMQIIAMIVGKPDFSALSFTVNHSEIRYGSFLNAIIAFLIVAVAMFAVVKAYNTMKKDKPDEEEEIAAEVQLLTEIRDSLRARQ